MLGEELLSPPDVPAVALTQQVCQPLPQPRYMVADVP